MAPLERDEAHNHLYYLFLASAIEIAYRATLPERMPDHYYPLLASTIATKAIVNCVSEHNYIATLFLRLLPSQQ
jgi:hypothetical protein